MNQKRMLIAGATGQIGAAVAGHFVKAAGWDVLGISRTAGSATDRAACSDPASDSARTGAGERQMPALISVDLLDADDCRRKLNDVPAITHLVYAARYTHAGGAPESVETNLQMFSNLLDAVRNRKELRHVHLVHGTKYYGHGFGPSAGPYREDDARHDRPLFYYPQQDLLMQRQREHDWDWTISRPHTFCDLSLREPRSITLLVAIYASVLKEMGLPLTFPGTQAAFEARTQFTWLPMLSRAIEWMIEDPRCANQAFNVVNNDPVRWSELWPAIAEYFGMEWDIGVPRRLADFPLGNAANWERIVAAHSLRQTDLSSVVQWAYGDYVFSPEWDVVSSMDKAAAYGFNDRIDTVAMWKQSFDFYRTHRLIP